MTYDELFFSVTELRLAGEFDAAVDLVTDEIGTLDSSSFSSLLDYEQHRAKLYALWESVQDQKDVGRKPNRHTGARRRPSRPAP